eukprot:3940785-Rhodomonas_salina.1
MRRSARTPTPHGAHRSVSYAPLALPAVVRVSLAPQAMTRVPLALPAVASTIHIGGEQRWHL